MTPNTISIIYMVVMGAIAIASMVLVFLQKQIIGIYKERVEKLYTDNDVVLAYCLSTILKNAIDKEDYETAERCRVLISQLNTYKTPPSP